MWRLRTPAPARVFGAVASGNTRLAQDGAPRAWGSHVEARLVLTHRPSAPLWRAPAACCADPPRTDDGVKNLYNRIGRMAAQKPLYADVTWGAGGSTSDLTLELCIEAQRRFDLNTNMHLTCTNMEEKKLTKALEGAKEAGIKNILALRGGARPQGAKSGPIVTHPPFPARAPPCRPARGPAGVDGCRRRLHLRPGPGALHSGKVRRRVLHHGRGLPRCGAAAGCVGVHLTSNVVEGHPNVIHKLEPGRELTEGERGRLVEHDGEQFVCSDEVRGGALKVYGALVSHSAHTPWRNRTTRRRWTTCRRRLRPARTWW